MMNPTTVWNESLNEHLCTATVTNTQVPCVSTSAPITTRSPVLATRVYRKNPVSVDKKSWRPDGGGSRNTELKDMAELQATATVMGPTPRYELRKTYKRIEAELKKVHNQTAGRCHVFLGKKQKLPRNNKLTEAQSQPGHNPELCRSNQANCLHSQMNGAADVFALVSNTSISSQAAGASMSASNTSRSPHAAGVSTSVPNTSRSPVPALQSTRVYRRNPASGAVDKKTRRPGGGLRKPNLKKMVELQSIASVIISVDNHNEIHKRMIAHTEVLNRQATFLAVTPAADVSTPATISPLSHRLVRLAQLNLRDERRLDRAQRHGCVRKRLPHLMYG